MLDKLAEMELRLNEIDELMASPSVAVDTTLLISLSRERASLEPVVSSYKEYLEIQHALEDTQSIIREADDPDLVTLAKEEVASLEDKRSAIEKDLKQALIPTDPSDTRNVFVEIRAATGGDEASLFAGDLYRMYSRYAQLQRWQVDLVDAHESEVGGFKEIIFQVNGRDVYSYLKYESGAHRVQRVPVTESSGRLHTSTATVAVLPEAEEVDIDIKDEDLRIDIFHAGGHGGQNVNKVATAVRVTHLATGIAAVCQDERSQLRNKEKALNVLRARLFDKAQREQQESLSQERRNKVGTGERSEKIRTYNFPQDRITDHRINKSFHNIQSILDGEMAPIVEPLREYEQSKRMESLWNNSHSS